MVAAFGEVENREAAMAEAYCVASLEPQTLVVRTTVGERRRQGRYVGTVKRAVGAQLPCDPTHQMDAKFIAGSGSGPWRGGPRTLHAGRCVPR